MTPSFSREDIRQVEVLTGDELRADIGKMHHRLPAPWPSEGEQAPALAVAIPEVEVKFSIGSDGAAGKVVFRLYNAGDGDDDRAFDCDIHTHNEGSWGLKQTQSAVGVAVEEFYRQGYDKKFGRIVGE